EVRDATGYGRKAVSHAARSGDDYQKEGSRTTLADALHQAGQWREAEKRFREAEEIRKKWFPKLPILSSLSGYRFCDLLLGRGRYREVMERAEKTINWEYGRLLDIALDHLSLGRAGVQQARESHQSGHWHRAKEHLDAAVDGLREAGYQYFLVQGLFARAEYYRLQTEFQKARSDLNEAHEIAENGDMKLFLADYHLESARLCIAEGKKTDAEEHLRKAEVIIKETGYLRREEELKEIINYQLSIKNC
ncbi:MAG: hypothetical protein GY940_36735, partial [bacterium]|nr:hypothetical protein [bacterium]